MLFVARKVFDILLTTTNGVHAFVSAILNLSHSFGFIIVKYIILFFTTIADVVKTVISVCHVLYEDFCIFFSDFTGKLSDVGLLLVNSAYFVVHIIKNGILAIKDSILYIYETVIDLFQLVIDSIAEGFDLVIDLAELLKWSIIVIGRGFWIAVQLIPFCIVYLGYSITSFILYMITTTYEHISAAASHCAIKTILAVEWTLSYLFDFPLESVLGLVLGCIALVGVKKYHARICRAMVHSVQRTIRLMRTALVCMWFIIIHNRFQLLRRNTPAPALDSDSDSTQDEEPVLPIRRSLRLQSRLPVKPSIKENPELLHRQLQQEKEEKLCVVCQDQNKCVIVMPCRHLCLCVDCSMILQHTTATCPICRNRFERILSVYM